MTRFSFRIRGSAAAVAIAAGLAVVAVVGHDAAAATAACTPSLGTVLGELPNIDGIVEPDNGWTPLTLSTGGVSVPFDPLQVSDPGYNRASLVYPVTGSTAAKLQLGMSGSDIYIAGVIDTAALHEDSTIVLAFSSKEPAPSTKRTEMGIMISPFSADQVAPSAASFVNARRVRDTSNTVRVKYTSTFAAPWTDLKAGVDKSWLDDPADVRFAYARGTSSWSFEIRIPRVTTPAQASILKPGGVYIGADNTTKFYFDVLNALAVGGGGFVVEQVPFPNVPMAPVTIGGSPVTDIQSCVPDTNGTAINTDRVDWADLTITSSPSPACGPGVSITDFGTLGGSQPSDIKRPDTGSQTNCNALSDDGSSSQSNQFYAKPTFDPATSPRLSTTFRIGKFGLPGPDDHEWDKMAQPSGGQPASQPSSTNPTPMAAISSGGMMSFYWALSPRQSCKYAQINSGWDHQCMEVELSSDDSNVRFINKSAQRNMYWVLTSQASASATIGTLGYPAPPGGSPDQDFILRVTNDTVSESLDDADFAGRTPPDCSEYDPYQGTSDCCDATQPTPEVIKAAPKKTAASVPPKTAGASAPKGGPQAPAKPAVAPAPAPAPVAKGAVRKANGVASPFAPLRATRKRAVTPAAASCKDPRTAPRLHESLRSVTAGLRRTGKNLSIFGKNFEIVERTGQYAYGARHFLEKQEQTLKDGDAVAWSMALAADGIKALGTARDVSPVLRSWDASGGGFVLGEQAVREHMPPASGDRSSFNFSDRQAPQTEEEAVQLLWDDTTATFKPTKFWTCYVGNFDYSPSSFERQAVKIDKSKCVRSDRPGSYTLPKPKVNDIYVVRVPASYYLNESNSPQTVATYGLVRVAKLTLDAPDAQGSTTDAFVQWLYPLREEGSTSTTQLFKLAIRQGQTATVSTTFNATEGAGQGSTTIATNGGVPTDGGIATDGGGGNPDGGIGGGGWWWSCGRCTAGPPTELTGIQTLVAWAGTLSCVSIFVVRRRRRDRRKK